MKITFSASAHKERGRWGFTLRLLSIEAGWINFKSTQMHSSLQITVYILLWEFWLGWFFVPAKKPYTQRERTIDVMMTPQQARSLLESIDAARSGEFAVKRTNSGRLVSVSIVDTPNDPNCKTGDGRYSAVDWGFGVNAKRAEVRAKLRRDQSK